LSLSPRQFKALIDRMSKPIHGFFRRRGCAEEDCQDLTQATFLRAFNSLDRYESQGKDDSWLFTIAANLWHNRHRHSTARKRSGQELAFGEEAAETEAPVAADPFEALVRKELWQRLSLAIQTLPDQMRHCLLLRIKGRSYREIALAQRIEEGTVKSHISQARTRLKKWLDEN